MSEAIPEDGFVFTIFFWWLFGKKASHHAALSLCQGNVFESSSLRSIFFDCFNLIIKCLVFTGHIRHPIGNGQGIASFWTSEKVII